MWLKGVGDDDVCVVGLEAVGDGDVCFAPGRGVVMMMCVCRPPAPLPGGGW